MVYPIDPNMDQRCVKGYHAYRDAGAGCPDLLFPGLHSLP